MTTAIPKIVTGKVRVLFPSLFTPALQLDKVTEKYEMTILIPKSDKKTVRAIEEAIEAAIEVGKVGTPKRAAFTDATVKKKTFFTPLRDGDEEKEEFELYAGCYFLKAKANKAPGVVDQHLQRIIDPDEVYSGCYARVQINFFPFNTAGNAGIGAGLMNVQKVADGEHLDAGYSSPEDVFEELEEDPLLD